VKYISESGKAIFKVADDDKLLMGPGFRHQFLNDAEVSHYAPKIRNMRNRNGNETITIFHQARPSMSEDFSWYLSSMKVILRNKNNDPVLVLSTSIPIDTNHFMVRKVQRFLDENNFLRHNSHLFESLTKRELDILKFIALGHSNEHIAEKLFISEETAATHRKNIKRKLQIKNSYDFIRFTQSFDLI
jgi:DNA-binding CsgD family transcriptional regulator